MWSKSILKNGSKINRRRNRELSMLANTNSYIQIKNIKTELRKDRNPKKKFRLQLSYIIVQTDNQNKRER